MAELTIQGKFVEIQELLFYRRMHSDAISHNLNDAERQTSFWRAEPKPFRLPKLRQNLHILRSVWKSAVSLVEKVRMSKFILRRIIWQRSQIIAEVKSEIVGRR
jgi:hypothetical protein